jgi:hypothetical protein
MARWRQVPRHLLDGGCPGPESVALWESLRITRSGVWPVLFRPILGHRTPTGAGDGYDVFGTSSDRARGMAVFFQATPLDTTGQLSLGYRAAVPIDRNRCSVPIAYPPPRTKGLMWLA